MCTRPVGAFRNRKYVIHELTAFHSRLYPRLLNSRKHCSLRIACRLKTPPSVISTPSNKRDSRVVIDTAHDRAHAQTAQTVKLGITEQVVVRLALCTVLRKMMCRLRCVPYLSRCCSVYITLLRCAPCLAIVVVPFAPYSVFVVVTFALCWVLATC